MKMEVTGKLKTHFNTAPKHNTTTAGVTVIMVSSQKHSQSNIQSIILPNFIFFCSTFQLVILQLS